MRRTPQWICVLVMAGAPLAWGQATQPAEMGSAGTQPVETVSKDALQIKGKIDAVTVYRGQALVSRIVEIGGPAGLREILVTDLPEAVVAGSIYAESADGVEVRSVRYRTRPVSEDVRDDVRKLDEQIRAVQDKIDANTRHVAVLAEHKGYLGKLEGFVAPTATAELTKGVLNADTLKQLTAFQLEQRKMVAEEELRLNVAGRELQKEISLLQRQRQQLTAGSARTMREAVVFVNLQRAENNLLRVRYLVGNANWLPSYNVRSVADQKDVRVEYYSNISQMSGEDWTDVAMTLSTATPSLVAKAPVLNPLAVALTASPAPGGPAAAQRPAGSMSASEYQSAREELNRKKLALENSRNADFFAWNSPNNGGNPFANGVANITFGNNFVPQGQPQPGQPAQQQDQQVFIAQDQRSNDLNLNSIASEMQILDLVTKGGVARSSKRERPAIDEGVSVTYQLTGRITLPSRADQQLIQIAALPMKADFYKLAIPVLTSYVYNEAAVTNTSQMVLLAGPVSAFLGGEFVGHADIPTVAIGENFTVGFGIDSSLRAGRELAEKNESVQTGNRTVDFTYRLTLENFGSAPAKVRLLDRIPTAKENEVRVELVSNGKPELSQDSRYQQTERKKGILRWDAEAPAQAIGVNAFSLEYKLRLEYDKQMHITGMPAVAAAR